MPVDRNVVQHAALVGIILVGFVVYLVWRVGVASSTVSGSPTDDGELAMKRARPAAPVVIPPLPAETGPSEVYIPPLPAETHEENDLPLADTPVIDGGDEVSVEVEAPPPPPSLPLVETSPPEETPTIAIESAETLSAPTQYKVNSGDTLSSIARKFYGTSSRWRELLTANRRQLPTPRALRPGMTLAIPNPTTAPVAGTATDTSSPEALHPKSYTVQPGDSLARIARMMYGTSRGWKTIYEANRQNIPEPNRLRIGTPLTIPSYNR